MKEKDLAPESRDAQTPSEQIRKWLTGWTVTVIVVPVLLIIAGMGITSYWSRPQLTVSITKAIVGSHRVVDSVGVHEYRAIVDPRTPCVAWLAKNSAASERVMPPAITPVVPRLVYGVYLENVGRVELTDIRMAFRATHGQFTVSGSPQLSLTKTQDVDPGGDIIHTVTVASLAPKARGVILGSLPVDNGSFSVVRSTESRFTVNYDLGEIDPAPESTLHVLFAGTRELNNVNLHVMSVNDFFGQQKSLFGLRAVNLPIDPIEFSAEGGEASTRIILAPYQACPTTAPEGSYTLSIHQRGAEETSTVAHASVLR